VAGQVLLVVDATMLEDTRRTLEEHDARLDPSDPWRHWLEDVAHRLGLAVETDRAATGLERGRLRLVR
jgi:hypothetical protein